MLGERDREHHRASSRAATSDMSPPLSLFSPAPPFSALDAGPFPLFGAKTELNDSLEPGNNDVMATRQASLVVPQEEPEQEHELHLDPKTAKKPEVHVIKRRNVGVPKFLRFLFQILEVEDPEIITWSHEGTAFQIIQPEELANQILPKYFKHNKVSSFQRQLNYFGFKKWTKTQTNICTFSHPFFLRADKDRMKLIKRKERANPAVLSAALAATIKANPIHLMNHLQSQEQARAQAETHFKAHDLVEARSQLPTQQALKRQKSNTLSGATVTFLNSAAAGRRHSTGMLPGSEAYGMAAAAAAAAAAAETATSSVPGRKRAGTPAEQEFELEMEARTGAVVNAPPTQNHILYLQKITEAKQLSERYPYQTVRGKRQSLPHVLPPGFGDSFGMGMNMNMPGSGNGVFGPRNNIINLGRRKSDQLLTDYSLGGSSGKSLLVNQIEEFMSSGTSLPSQTVFASNVKSDTSMVLPISSNSLNQDEYQLQPQRQEQQQQHHLQQQMNRQQNIFGEQSGYGPSNIKSESNGWPTSINGSSSSAANTPYPRQPHNHSMMMPFKFGDSNAQNTVPSFHMEYHRSSSGSEGKLQQRPQMNHPQEYSSQPERVLSYHQQQQQERQESNQEDQARDYIDVLLESAGLDENLPQSSTALSSESWNEPNYVQSQNGHGSSGSAGPYSFMQPQQQNQQQVQLSAMGGMPHNSQRF